MAAMFSRPSARAASMRLRNTPLLSFGRWLKGSVSRSKLALAGLLVAESFRMTALRLAALAFAICSLKAVEDFEAAVGGVSGGPSICDIEEPGLTVFVVVVPAGLTEDLTLGLTSLEVAGVAAFVIGGFVPMRLAGNAEVGGLIPRTEALNEFVLGVGGLLDRTDELNGRGVEIAGGGLVARTDELNDCVVEAPRDGRCIEALTDLRDSVGLE